MVVARGCRFKKALREGKLNTLNTSLSLRFTQRSYKTFLGSAEFIISDPGWLALRLRTPGGCVRSCKSPEKQRWPKGMEWPRGGWLINSITVN